MNKKKKNYYIYRGGYLNRNRQGHSNDLPS